MKTNNPFVNEARDLASHTTTENGAIAYRDTSDGLVDLFGVIGALRNEITCDCPQRLHTLIDGAYATDKTLLAKMLFYTRDVRGALAERDTIREAIKYCAEKYPEIIKCNIPLIPEYGRWDDMFSLIGTPLEDDMWAFVKSVYDQDLLAVENGSNAVSLLAKWLPSADASSENTRRKGCYAAKRLSDSVYNYKREVKSLRRVINTIESHISAKDWGTYDYSKIPSYAMMKYSSAFARNDSERYAQYLSDVFKGKAKINASTLYPYDIVRRVWSTPSHNVQEHALCDELWKNLPNYVKGENNYLVMADVSGSMAGLPLYSSIGLALYFAERNRGAFNGLFMTFSAHPEFVHIPKHLTTLSAKCSFIGGADWGGNTNLEAAFDEILKVAIASKSTNADLPKSLIIITDMEFDSAVRTDLTFFDAMKEKFANAGYDMPNVVFWNVNRRNETYHAKVDAPNVQLVSGQSASTFRTLIEGLNKTPYELMVMALSNKRYDPIRVE